MIKKIDEKTLYQLITNDIWLEIFTFVKLNIYLTIYIYIYI